MNLLINTSDDVQGTPVALEDLILTVGQPTTGGSNMLENFTSLFPAEIVERLSSAGYGIAGKANIGEFGFDLLGETSAFGACVDSDGTLAYAGSRLLDEGSAVAVVGLDVNGTQRRAAAQNGQVCVKPTYGTVSRFGTIAVACSGETVSIMAKTPADARAVLGVLAGHDDKDGTSLPEERCQAAQDAHFAFSGKKMAVARSLAAAADDDVRTCMEAFFAFARAEGYMVEEVDDALMVAARPAWNILMSAELCNNVSRFDGVKYGYRSQDAQSIDDLYTNSRTEAFGDVLKTTILFGSEMLSEQNYFPRYDKSLRMRRLVCERFAQLFDEYAFVVMPACSQMAYAAKDCESDPYRCFTENAFTAPASLTGLPAVVAGGVQMVGPAISDAALLALAEKYCASSAFATIEAAKEVR